MVKVKNSRHGVHNPNARYPKEYGVDDVAASPVVADPLRLLEICATSDGGAAIVVSSMEYARSRTGIDDPVRVAGISTVGPDLSRHASSTCRTWRRTRGPRRATSTTRSRTQIAGRAYEEAGVGPDDLDLAEVYDLSSASSSTGTRQIGLCERARPSKLRSRGRHHHRRPHPGQRERRARRVRRGHPRPGHRPGLRAHLAAARPGRRPPGRRRQVGLTINQGLFGHGSAP
jgi:acetyl-CoA acetyltransferase